MPNAPKTPQRVIRMDDQLWDELGRLADQLGTDRSAVIRELARSWVKRQRRQATSSEARATSRSPAAVTRDFFDS